MRRFIFFLCIGMFSFISIGTTEPYTLSVCAIFKNEAPYLKEWIEFHRMVGAEHFILYNNDSDDHYLDVLTSYIEQGIVEVVDWPNQMDDVNWTSAQKRAYDHCVYRNKDKTKWLALIDIDEFIVPVDFPDIPSYLSQFDQDPSIGGVRINWQLYGTSGLYDIPEGKLFTECLTFKAPTYYTAEKGVDNIQFKSIVRPETVDHCDMHYSIYKPGFASYPPEDKDNPIQVNHIRLNHYWPRTEKFFYQVKLNRRLQLFPLAKEQMLGKLPILNQEEDLIMMRFIPELKKRMNP